jgi:hypothetical protein
MGHGTNTDTAKDYEVFGSPIVRAWIRGPSVTHQFLSVVLFVALLSMLLAVLR